MSDVQHEPLPTDYSANPAAAEDAVLARWRSEKTFEQVLAARAKHEPFVFWEGPPTANGRPGIHHVLARTLKDAVCRYQTMLGKRVERKAGWDTHGLPVELEVEKALGISGKPAIEGLPPDPVTGLSGVARFNDECRKSVWKYRDDWEKLSERIGFWLDYEHPYVTYDPKYVDSLWYLLARLHKAGHVYRGKRVLPYCGRCGTALSSHELGQPGVYKDVNDPSVYVRFRLVDSKLSEPESFLAWTTTPWTLPSNIALAVHPERDYGLYSVTQPDGATEHLWIAVECAERVFKNAGLKLQDPHFAQDTPKQSDVSKRILVAGPGWIRKGKDLGGLRYVPLFDAHVPTVDPGAWKPDAEASYRVYAADYVTVEDGTGIVHQAPSYGADDWATAQRNRLTVLQAVGADGRFAAKVAAVEHGTFFKEADDALMDDLKGRGLLFKKAREPHSYPHCWRCSTPLFYFAAPAWFARTTAIKERMIELNRRVRWVPEEVGTARFGEWLENNVDWNISRDRYWGTPLPYWVCHSCDREVAIEGLDDLRDHVDRLPLPGRDGSGQFGFSMIPAEFNMHKPAVDQIGFACPDCGGEMIRTRAVVDVWFDSGAMPFAQYGWPHLPGSREKVREQFPADFICEGLDQTRGWFYTLHALGAFMTQAEPELGDTPAFKACMVNGLVLDKDGVKMSKRLGNVVNPWDAITQHGVDALRWYFVASGSPWLPKRFDPEALAEVRRGFFGTLYNSYKFFQEYARIDRFDPNDARIPAVAARPEIDRWLVSRAQSLLAEARERYDDYDYGGAARAVQSFVIDELSNWYIRRNRRRFWKGETGADKLAAFATLRFALRTTALLMAPLAPFLAELIWQRLEPVTGSVHAQLLPQANPRELAPELEASMRVVQRIVVMGRSLREKAGIKVRQPLRALHVRSSDDAALVLLRKRFASELVLDELNIKSWGSLAADDGKLVKLSGKANFRVLGKKLGARMKAAAAAIEKLDPVALASLRTGSGVTIRADGESVELTSEDVLIQVESSATFDVETDGRFVVWLDTELDEALVAEGWARETVNRVNALRKESGLAVEERILLQLAPEDELLRRALELHRALIAGETLACEIQFVAPSALANAPGVQRWDLGSNHWLQAALRAV